MSEKDEVKDVKEETKEESSSGWEKRKADYAEKIKAEVK